MTANVGVISVEPGGFNVIPGVCEFTIDVRSPTPEGLARVERYVHETLAGDRRRGAPRPRARRDAPARPAADGRSGLVDTLEQAAAELEGASSTRLTSGAAHDAMILGRHVPAAMLFVPSRGGISHSPEELTEPRPASSAPVLGRALAALVA